MKKPDRDKIVAFLGMELEGPIIKEGILYRNVPKVPALYFLFNKRNKLVYLGQTKNLSLRMMQHKTFNIFRAENFKPFNHFYYCKCEEQMLKSIEKRLIDKFRPRYNAMVLIRRHEYLGVGTKIEDALKSYEALF